MARRETKQTSNFEARDVAEELLKKVREHEGSFDEDFRLALAQNYFARWLGDPREPGLAEDVAVIMRAEIGCRDDELSLDWWVANSEDHQAELIDQQEGIVNEIDENKAKLESHQEIVKSLKASIDEDHTRLRQLARALKSPWVPQLPATPSRQREIVFADGEEWRAVPLAEVLKDDPSLKSVAMEKLGNVTLEKYAELHERHGNRDKPQKLTRKQWDKIEALVQDFHEVNAPEVADGDDQGAPIGGSDAA